MNHKTSIEHLKKFRNNPFFDEESWEERGIVPSDSETIQQLENAKNNLIDELVIAHEHSADRDALYAVAIKHFEKCLNDTALDTEETEFLGDCICDIAQAANIDSFLEDSETWMLNR